MIERNDWKLFAKMLIFLASIFILDFLTNLTSVAIVIVVGTIFFIKYIENKIQLISYFSKKKLGFNDSISEIKLNISRMQKVHDETQDEYQTSNKINNDAKKIEAANIKNFNQIKEFEKKLDVNTQRKDFLLHLNSKRWQYWFAILGCLSILRFLEVINIIWFSSTMAMLIALVSCFYIFRFNPENEFESSEEYDIAHKLYKSKIIFGGLISLFFLNGAIGHQQLPILIALTGYFMIISLTIVIFRTLFSEEAKTSKECAIEYLIAYKKGLSLKDLLIENTSKYLNSIKTINSSFLYKYNASF